jgi:hypothetical protein
MTIHPEGTNPQTSRVQMLLAVARGYYEEQRTMDALAKDWNVSRSTVSRRGIAASWRSGCTTQLTVCANWPSPSPVGSA